MAIPATDIQLSAVNTELGSGSTATVNLNNIRVRSLGSNLSTGSSFGMSGFAGQSGTWVQAVNSASDYSQFINQSGGGLMPLADQSCFYEIYQHMFDINTQETQIQIRKLYLNGQTAQVTAITGLGVPQEDYPIAAGMGPNTDSDLYIMITAPLRLVRINSAGSVVAQKTYTVNGYVMNWDGTTRSLAVDSSGNVYFAYGLTGVGAGIDQFGIVSVDSSLNPRWAISFPRVFSPEIESRLTRITCDSSGNIWAYMWEKNSGLAWTNGVGLIKLNSSGTILSRTAFTTRTAINGSYPFGAPTSIYSTAAGYAVSSSSPGGIYTLYISFYNNLGTLQWVKELTAINNSVIPYEIGACTTDSAGNVYALVGAVNSGFTTLYLSYLIKLNSSGTLQWQRKFTYTLGASDGGIMPSNSSQSLYFSGENDSRITLFFHGGVIDQYGSSLGPVVFTVKSDGSGTGTYSLGTFGSTAISATYQTTSDIVVTTGSQTSMTPASTGAAPTIVAVASTAISNMTPVTLSAPRTNI